jgi:hypothetical protein
MRVRVLVQTLPERVLICFRASAAVIVRIPFLESLKSAEILRMSLSTLKPKASALTSPQMQQAKSPSGRTSKPASVSQQAAWHHYDRSAAICLRRAPC